MQFTHPFIKYRAKRCSSVLHRELSLLFSLLLSLNLIFFALPRLLMLASSGTLRAFSAQHRRHHTFLTLPLMGLAIAFPKVFAAILAEFWAVVRCCVGPSAPGWCHAEGGLIIGGWIDGGYQSLERSAKKADAVVPIPIGKAVSAL